MDENKNLPAIRGELTRVVDLMLGDEISGEGYVTSLAARADGTIRYGVNGGDYEIRRADEQVPILRPQGAPARPYADERGTLAVLGAAKGLASALDAIRTAHQG